MRTVSLRLVDLPKTTIPIGYVAENEHTQVRIDCKTIFDDYANATPALAVRPPQGDDYPATVTRDGTYVIWDVLDSDLVYEGTGEIQLTFTTDGIVAKSYIGKTRIYRSIVADGEAPDPIQDWMAEADNALYELENLSASATGLAAGASPTAQITEVEGHKNIALGIPKGDKGDTGSQGPQGEPGDPTELIDDTSTTDTGKTWSASKLNTDISAKYTKPGSGIPKTDLAGAVQTSLEKADTAYQKDSSGIPASDMTSGVQASLGKADTAYQKPYAGIPATDLEESAQTKLGKADTAYQKPSGGIPDTDLSAAVQASLGKADTAYQKSGNGIPKTDLASGVQTSLGKADTAYQLPVGGIPATDIADGVIPELTDLIDDTADEGDTDVTWSADKIAEEDGKLKSQIDSCQNSKAPVIVESVSGEIASFADGADGMPVEKLVVNIDPVQDLHGQDSPYPAGGGKNKYPILIGTDNATNYNGGSATNDNGTLVVDVTTTLYSGCYMNSSSEAYKLASKMSEQCTVSYYAKADKNLNVFIGYQQHGNSNKSLTTSWQRFADTATFDGTGYTFNIYNGNTNDNPVAGIVYIKDLMFETGSTASDFAPYSNICPISGWTGCNVSRTEKNLLDISNAVNVTNVFDSVDADGTIHIKDTSPKWSNTFVGELFVVKGQTYTISASNMTYGRFGFSTSKTLYPRTGLTPDITIVSTGSIPSTIVKRKITSCAFVANSTGVIYLYYCSDTYYDDYHETFSTTIQVELGSTVSEYTPYVGTTYPVSWETEAGTVYGGSLDAITGELTVDRAIVDLGTLTWAKNNTSGGELKRFYAPLQDAKETASSGTEAPNAICTIYKAVSPNKTYLMSDIGFTISYGVNRNIMIYDPLHEDDTPEQFKSFLSGQTVAYELATPQTYQLTPIEVTTLLGINNIYADTGAVSVDYPADTKSYVDQNEGVKDVQVNGTSIVSNGVANVPLSAYNKNGVVKTTASYGLKMGGTDNSYIQVLTAENSDIKAGAHAYKPITPSNQDKATYYGLSKLAGVDLANETVTVGAYPENAKSAISEMLNGSVSVSGTTPSITGKAGIRYVCGECATLSITPPASGDVEVIFSSGSTPTVLTVPNTVKFPAWFSPSSLEANATYDIIITNATLGVVMAWT